MPLNRRQMLSGTALTGAAVLTASSGLLAPVAAAATVPSAGTRTQSVSPRGVPVPGAWIVRGRRAVGCAHRDHSAGPAPISSVLARSACR